jgi:hypothetical protein
MKARLVRKLEEDTINFQQGDDVLRDDHIGRPLLHKCILEKYTENSYDAERIGRLGVNSDYEDAVFDRNFAHLTGFSFDSPGRAAGRECHGCNFDEDQSMLRCFKGCLGRDGNLYLQTEIVIELTREEPDGNYSWNTLYEQLTAYPVFICPHRSLSQLMHDLLDRYGYDTTYHNLYEEDADINELSLLRCKFCSTRVRRFTWVGPGRRDDYTKRYRHVSVSTIRNLGKATDAADENWHKQTVFSSEVLERDEDKEQRSPWRSWWGGPASESVLEDWESEDWESEDWESEESESEESESEESESELEG